MLVVANVAKVPLHVVDGGAAVVAEGAPAQGVPIRTGFGGFGDIYGGRKYRVGVIAGMRQTMGRLGCWGGGPQAP